MLQLACAPKVSALLYREVRSGATAKASGALTEMRATKSKFAAASVALTIWFVAQLSFPGAGYALEPDQPFPRPISPPIFQLPRSQLPAAAPARAPTAAPAPTNFMVFFDRDKSNIPPEASRIIVAVAQAAKDAGSAKIKVTGYTDLSGGAKYNLELSLRRAEAVERELEKDGIPASEIAVDGKGKSDPLVPTADGVREPRNRRAVIEIEIGGV